MVNLIGVAGRAGSGKDEVGKMIQYLDHSKRLNNIRTNYGDYRNLFESESFDLYSKWKIKKFAQKVKQIASILTGIPVEKFEDQEFKKQILGEEWTKYSIIPSMKSVSKVINVPTEEEAKKYSKTYGLSMNRDYSFNKSHYIEHKLTVRQLLQRIGTEAIREQIHPNVWVNALFADYKPIGDNLLEGEVRKVREDDLIYPNWIITDMRFPNEVKAVKDRGGITIRVNRPLKYTDDIVRASGMTMSLKAHPSETFLDSYKDWDYVIDNDGDLNELLIKVKEICKKENII